jgi:hypothetical protein
MDGIGERRRLDPLNRPSLDSANGIRRSGINMGAVSAALEHLDKWEDELNNSTRENVSSRLRPAESKEKSGEKEPDIISPWTVFKHGRVIGNVFLFENNDGTLSAKVSTDSGEKTIRHDNILGIPIGMGLSELREHYTVSLHLTDEPSGVDDRNTIRFSPAERLLGGADIHIGEDHWRSRASAVRDIFSRIVAPHLNDNGLRSYGMKTALDRYLKFLGESSAEADRGGTVVFSTQETFLTGFLNFLEIFYPHRLAFINIPNLNRPAWPDGLREELGHVEGNNIRHVIRNATLLRALDAAFNNFELEGRETFFNNLAEAIGIARGDTLDTTIKNIYHALYLNPGNLFSGPAFENQLIGLSADDVAAATNTIIDTAINTGELMEGGWIETRHVYDHIVDNILKRNFNFIQVEDTEDFYVELGNGLRSYLHSFGDHINIDRLGNILIELGQNFGFDLPYAESPIRVPILIQAEIALQDFIENPRTQTPDSLMRVFQDFMGLGAAAEHRNENHIIEEKEENK